MDTAAISRQPLAAPTVGPESLSPKGDTGRGADTDGPLLVRLGVQLGHRLGGRPPLRGPAAPRESLQQHKQLRPARFSLATPARSGPDRTYSTATRPTSENAYEIHR